MSHTFTSAGTFVTRLTRADRVAEGDEDLLELNAGKGVRWIPGEGWVEE